MTKFTFLLIALLCCASMASGQPYAVGHVTSSFVDPSRNNRNVPVEIYYPATSEGDGTPVADNVFPVLAFGHGFVMTTDAYANIWNLLVPEGFIMVLPKTEGGITPSHLEFAKDLNFSIGRLQVLSADPTSDFFGKVSSQSGVMGHSMGGGAAVLAAGLNPGLDVMSVLAPAETNPSAIAAAANVLIPSLVIAAENDCVTPPATNQLPIYDALISDCKTYLSIVGGSHCQMAEENFFCSFGESTCSPQPSITRDTQHDIIGNYLPKWLRAQLLDDCVAGAAFNVALESDAAVSYERNCILCDALQTGEAALVSLKLSPNPFSQQLSISFGNNSFPARLTIFDMTMRQVFSATLTGDSVIDTSGFPQGMFLCVLDCGNEVLVGKVVKI